MIMQIMMASTEMLIFFPPLHLGPESQQVNT